VTTREREGVEVGREAVGELVAVAQERVSTVARRSATGRRRRKLRVAYERLTIIPSFLAP
jgi:hypothetical protein